MTGYDFSGGTAWHPLDVRDSHEVIRRIRQCDNPVDRIVNLTSLWLRYTLLSILAGKKDYPEIINALQTCVEWYREYRQYAFAKQDFFQRNEEYTNQLLMIPFAETSQVSQLGAVRAIFSKETVQYVAQEWDDTVSDWYLPAVRSFFEDKEVLRIDECPTQFTKGQIISCARRFADQAITSICTTSTYFDNCGLFCIIETLGKQKKKLNSSVRLPSRLFVLQWEKGSRTVAFDQFTLEMRPQDECIFLLFDCSHYDCLLPIQCTGRMTASKIDRLF